jgi:hypothetical protein
MAHFRVLVEEFPELVFVAWGEKDGLPPLSRHDGTSQLGVGMRCGVVPGLAGDTLVAEFLRNLPKAGAT